MPLDETNEVGYHQTTEATGSLGILPFRLESYDELRGNPFHVLEEHHSQQEDIARVDIQTHATFCWQGAISNRHESA